MAYRGKYTAVYGTSKNGEFIHYVRLCPLETHQYPHGLALSTKCKTAKEAENFAKLFDDYIDAFIESVKE